MRGERALRRFERAGSLALALAVVAAIACVAGALSGHRLLVERSDSMQPRLRAGDVLVTAREPATAIRTGDIVTFANAARGDRLVTHRVVAIARRDGRLVFTTRGDANSAAESFAVPTGASVQRLTTHLPGIARVVASAPGLAGWTQVPAALALLIGSFVLVRRKGGVR
jgi:signal peptidase